MDPALKHRLIGAAVLSALAIIFLPMLMVEPDQNTTVASVPLTVPAAPAGNFQTKELPLVSPASGVPEGGVVGLNTAHPPASPASASPVASARKGGAPPPSGSPAPGNLPASGAATPAPAAATSATPGKNSGIPPVPPPAGTKPVAATPTAGAGTPAQKAPMPANVPVVAPASATAPIPAANAGGHYVVSLGSYSNAANAQSLVASLKAKQLPAYAESVVMLGKPATRVRIGPFQQRGDAEAARLKAQQVRTDMPTSVTALDAAAPAPPEPGPAKPVTAAAVPPLKTGTKPASPAAQPASGKSPATIANTATASPAKPDIRPVEPSPAAAGRGYAVQVSAFRSEDEALTLRNKLRNAGFTAFSEKIQAESGTLFRVRIGPEADRDGADHLRTELSAKLGLNGMVVAYP